MTPECRSTIEKYRAHPRGLDGHLLARIRALEKVHWSWVQKPDRLSKKLAFVAAFFALVGIAEWIWTPSRLLLPLAGLAALGAAGARVEHLNSRRRELLRKATEGHCLLAYVVMANTSLFEPSKTPMPAAVVVRADEENAFDEGFLAEQAAKIWKLREMDAPPSPDVKAVWESIRDDFSIRFTRLPASMSGNENTYLAHLIIDPAILPGSCLNDKALPVLLAAPKRVLRLMLLHI